MPVFIRAAFVDILGLHGAIRLLVSLLVYHATRPSMDERIGEGFEICIDHAFKGWALGAGEFCGS